MCSADGDGMMTVQAQPPIRRFQRLDDHARVSAGPSPAPVTGLVEDQASGCIFESARRDPMPNPFGAGPRKERSTHVADAGCGTRLCHPGLMNSRRLAICWARPPMSLSLRVAVVERAEGMVLSPTVSRNEHRFFCRWTEADLVRASSCSVGSCPMSTPSDQSRACPPQVS